MATMYYFKNEVRSKYDEFKFRTQNQVRRAYNWCCNNPELALAIGGTALTAVRFLGKNTVKYINTSKQKAVKDLYCYDNRLGHYWALKRELTNKEWLTIDARKRNGEALSDILSELKVLK